MTKRVLCIIADPDTRIDSFSSSVTRAFLDELRASEADCEITEINLYEMDLPALNTNLIKRVEATGKERNELPVQEQTKEMEKFNLILDQLINSSAVVFISRTIGFGLPAQLKSFIETLAATKLIEKLNNKKGIHLRIEDDMLTPVFITDEPDLLRNFLVEWSINMMDTLTLSHRHLSAEKQENPLLEMIKDTRETAQEFAAFIDKSSS